MIDLHCHLLPGIDDGSRDISMSLSMARCFAEQGVTHVACTPHILPGVYHNTGPDIRKRVDRLQEQLNQSGIALTLITGADNHITPNFVQGLKDGHLLSLGDSRYVLVEPPHNLAPKRLDDLFFSILLAGYVPILTHPERLRWIESKYDLIRTLSQRGVWMQITSGSLSGSFGKRARYWAERMLSEGLVHILATDAHNLDRRPPDLIEGYKRAELILGSAAAEDLVVNRPRAVLMNEAPEIVSAPQARTEYSEPDIEHTENNSHAGRRHLVDRLRGLFH